MEENVVYIGKKGTMAYVLAVVTQMNRGVQEVVIRARGKAISRAVDVAEIVRHKFLQDALLSRISTTTEEVQTGDGKPLKVSAIEIRLSRRGGESAAPAAEKEAPAAAENAQAPSQGAEEGGGQASASGEDAGRPAAPAP